MEVKFGMASPIVFVVLVPATMNVLKEKAFVVDSNAITNKMAMSVAEIRPISKAIVVVEMMF